MSNLLRDPPKHQCPECQSQCDYHATVANYGIFSCPTCQSKFSTWRSFAYFSGIVWLIYIFLRLFDWVGASDLMLVVLFFIGIVVMVAFAGFGNHIWTLQIKRIPGKTKED
ncbi:hypothetical protein M2R47_04145 [Moraxella sp. Tifton1]|uniref:Uncharacterized protein n=1 Tax=Moraxella oculi TaxID=2940516 RepID=A0ABW8UCD3_9GAMM|nr:hypothetical protein [Moraxella sp. Tifton1]MCL1623441.1 hypothetical protein [Moraxella sp. Tifton1]